MYSGRSLVSQMKATSSRLELSFFPADEGTTDELLDTRIS